MKKFALSSLLCATVAAGAFSAHASGLGDALRGQLGGGAAESSSSASGLGGMLGGSGGSSALSALGLGNLSSGTASNAAGVLTYCMKNNYLNADKAAQVKNQLLGKLGLGQKEEPKDQGYQNGLMGMVTGADGKSFSLDKVKSNLKEKACDFVLDNAKSLI
ncbi:UNVERIFIED_CONTAM: DUF2501 domain-containing protein [Comamonas sp. A-3]|uniref:DUF2501 domain-containing protein n=5 Tax=Comamonas thiooxydans TaxID=363952 RepID=A0A454XX18_9BURK|nr:MULTISPECIES: DUF2501 domain-containing protein [Comamonas]ACY35021.1 conserved hypothetical protein [Comamonas thiooxydans]EFI60231.1 hypothetical protein CTS44_19637 [Comamonas thiooxydans]KGH00798.1 hypothetical protein P245_00945 [Comamonas thiooxydans]MDH1333159.1 DUF2501 domain-containing protein [Comamonas thiooxydans]MDH1474626.1 DUF2501 domain-containing protein [Comamonas thiooxydans]